MVHTIFLPSPRSRNQLSADIDAVIGVNGPVSGWIETSLPGCVAPDRVNNRASGEQILPFNGTGKARYVVGREACYRPVWRVIVSVSTNCVCCNADD